MKNLVLNPDVDIREVSSTPKHHFFGFYDKSPWSGSNRYLCCLETNFSHRTPCVDDTANVCIIDTEDSDSIRIIGNTSAWNFQQGARLQWAGSNYENLVYNDKDNGNIVARIYDVNKGSKRTIDNPIYTVGPDGQSAMTMNFRRTREGYSYAYPSDKPELDPIPSDDGVYRINMSNGSIELLVSLADLADINPVKTMENGLHWIDHITYNPSGNKVAFLHRWELSDGGLYTRLFTIDIDGKEANCIVDSGKATHYDWKSDCEILVWTRIQESISSAARKGLFGNRFLKPVVNKIRQATIPPSVRQNIMKDGFYLFDIKNSNYERIGKGTLTRDGHPSFFSEGRWMVSDTYPNSKNERELYIFDFESKVKTEIGRFQSSPDHDKTAIRCDLHPRWGREGECISIDSFHTGTRQMYVLKVKELLC